MARSMKFPRKTIAISTALIVGAGVWLISQKSSAASDKKVEKPQVLELAASDLALVVQSDLSQPVSLHGSLSPARQTVLGAEVDGVVMEVLVRPGQAVKQGQLLARFETQNLQDMLTTRQANLERSQAELRLAEKNQVRNKHLLQQSFISGNAFDSSESGFSAARAQVKSDQAQLEIARKALRDATVRAPFAGVIAERLIEPGSKVGMNQRLFGLVDLAQLEFTAEVPMNALAKVKIGQDVSLMVEGFSSQRFSGRLERIAPVAQAGTRMVPVYIRVNNPDGALKGGMYAQAELTVAKVAAANVLPLAALRGLTENKPHVLLVENGKAVSRPVVLGLVNELNKTVAISSGVQAGQQVVVAKLDNIKPGQALKLPTTSKPKA